jgi:hypothetical protein
MSDKSKSVVRKLLKLAVVVFPAIFNIVYNVPKFVAQEAKTSTNNLLVTVILSIFFTMLLTVSWICLLGLFFLLCISLNYSTIASLTFTLILNILALLIVGLMIIKVKKKIFDFFRRQR